MERGVKVMGKERKQKLLMHACCAPCFTYIEKELKEKGLRNEDGTFTPVDYTACFYNPNIHPKVEYTRRKDAFIQFCEEKNVPHVVMDVYDMNDYVKYVVENVGEGKRYPIRCEYCYEMRMRKVFEYAKEQGYDIVSTTLTISPYQNHECIQLVGERLAKEFGIIFHYVDYRDSFRLGQRIARETGMYMQKYCGCVFSFDARKVGILDE